MNVVMVQHDGGDTRRYCFEVPDRLRRHIAPSTRVVCDTRHGVQRGTVVSEVMTGEDAELAIKENYATLPLREVVSVITEFRMDEIRLPHRMQGSKPQRAKLLRRMQELKDIGAVTTRVVVSDNGILEDGYTAYLAWKKQGLDTIPILMYDWGGAIWVWNIGSFRELASRPTSFYLAWTKKLARFLRERLPECGSIVDEMDRMLASGKFDGLDIHDYLFGYLSLFESPALMENHNVPCQKPGNPSSHWKKWKVD